MGRVVLSCHGRHIVFVGIWSHDPQDRPFEPWAYKMRLCLTVNNVKGTKCSAKNYDASATALSALKSNLRVYNSVHAVVKTCTV